MGSLVEDGALLVEPDFNPETVQIEFRKSIYAQLAVAAWSQTANTVPFITWDDGDCGSVAAAYMDTPSNVPGAIVDVDWSKVGVTISGRCYYLLGAVTIDCCSITDDKTKRALGPGGCPPQDPNPDNGSPNGPKPASCWNVGILPGGSTDVLTGDSGTYNGLVIGDFINSVVAGWAANGNTNGYGPISASTTTYPSTIGGAGFITQIPVCDYRNGDTNAGKSCPNLSTTSK